MKKYQVQQGDTLSGIAKREYGDANLYPVIALQNHLADPDVIQVGQELLVPYVTRRHHVTQDDSTAMRQQITQRLLRHSGHPDTADLGDRQRGRAAADPAGAWLLIPDIADVGHHTVVDDETLRCWRTAGTATSTSAS